MHYRQLGKSGIQVSEIGFGGWGIGGWGVLDDAQALSALDRAFDLGITFYDTAMGYGNGHPPIGDLRQRSTYRQDLQNPARQGGDREQDPAQDRCVAREAASTVARPGGPGETTFPADWIVECTEQSLRQLDSDYVDVMQFHAWTDPYTYLDEWREAFLKLKQQGKIRAFGVSVNDWDPPGPPGRATAGSTSRDQAEWTPSR